MNTQHTGLHLFGSLHNKPTTQCWQVWHGTLIACFGRTTSGLLPSVVQDAEQASLPGPAVFAAGIAYVSEL